MLSALLLAILLGSPGLVLLSSACGRGASPWPWPRGLTVGVAFGVVLSAIVATLLGAFGLYSLSTEFLGVAAVTVVVAASTGFRFAWPFARASVVESVGFVVVAALASGVFLGRPFEMLLGERDATVYTVSGIGLARQGSIVLHDRTADIIGSEAMRQFYPVFPGQKDSLLHSSQFVKYPGFYYVDTARSLVLPQGLPLLPALIAIFYGAYGLSGALAANNFVGVLAVLAVLACGAELVGDVAAVVAATLLALDVVEVWAARYPVAEILFQMALFAGFAAFLRKDRIGQAIAGFLLGATLLAKIEAALILAPIAMYGLVAALRRTPTPGSAFWMTFAGTSLASAVYWLFFQVGYFQMAYTFFMRVEGKTISGLLSFHIASFIALTLAAAFVGLGLWAAASSLAMRSGLVRSVGRWAAIAVVVLGAFAYFVRPHLAAGIFGQKMTLVWLGWYVSRPVLWIGILGLAHFLWTRAAPADLWVTAILLTLSVVFLHFTFVKPTHIYLTRRFVPAALPLVFLSFGYAVARLADVRFQLRPSLALLAAGTLFGASVLAIVARGRHLYRHREYAGLARQFSDLAASLRDRRLVFLSDTDARNLLGPALEFVFGVPTLVVRPQPFQDRHELIQRWLDEEMPIGAVTMTQPLEKVPAAADFQAVDNVVWRFRALHQVYDQFPHDIWDGLLSINRYAAGPGSDPLYEFWKRQGARIADAVCSRGVRLLGGNRFLVHRMLTRCPSPDSSPRTSGYLVADSEAASWEKALAVYGARFAKHDLGGVVLLDDVAPEEARDAAPLATTGWKLEASNGHGSEASAIDGRLDTRWGSRAPQHPGMTFTVTFPEATDVSWVKIRMGGFSSDRARPLAFETSVDGERWNRQEVPPVLEGIRWQDGAPEENANGDVDLWVNARGVRSLRLVNLGTSPRFDWSIAELEIDGKPAR